MPKFETKEEYEAWKAGKMADLQTPNSEKPATEKNNFYTKWGHWIVIALSLSVFFYAIFGGSGEHRPSFFIGDHVRISAAPSKIAIIPVHEAAFEKMGRIADAKDQIGLAVLMASGNAFMVDDGVSVLVLEINPNLAQSHATRIRILEGPKTGYEGWIYTSFLRK